MRVASETGAGGRQGACLPASTAQPAVAPAARFASSMRHWGASGAAVLVSTADATMNTGMARVVPAAAWCGVNGGARGPSGSTDNRSGRTASMVMHACANHALAIRRTSAALLLRRLRRQRHGCECGRPAGRALLPAGRHSQGCRRHSPQEPGLAAAAHTESKGCRVLLHRHLLL